MRDLIDRQVALDAIDALVAMQSQCTSSQVALIQGGKIWQQIRDLPSAQPKKRNENMIISIMPSRYPLMPPVKHTRTEISNCHNCGAPVDPCLDRCPYCLTPYAAASRRVQTKRTCDTCKHYHWYYDKCDLYDCEVDPRSTCTTWDAHFPKPLGTAEAH